MWPKLQGRGLHEGANARGRGSLEVASHDFLVMTQAGLSLHIEASFHCFTGGQDKTQNPRDS